MFIKAIVRAPSANFATGLTSVALGAPDYHVATRQHAAYCEALQSCGLSLIRLPSDERHPDSTFVEDTAIVTSRGAVITRPGAPTRLGEASEIRRELVKHFSKLNTITEPGTLDGGDVCEAGGHFFIGISHRTNDAGARQLAKY